MYIVNGFSFNMLSSLRALIRSTPISVDEAARYAATCESAVGHADVAAIFSATLGVPIAMNRATIKVAPGQSVLLGSYIGPRLSEGTKELPEGATIEWAIIDIERWQ